MPIYEYKHCDTELEIYQTIGDNPPVCEKCGGEMARKYSPTLIKIISGGVLARSKGYKEGYRKEVLKSKGIDE